MRLWAAADYLKSWIGDSEAGAAELLLKELTYRPLAITQAAAYLTVKRAPIPEYLRLLRRADQETASLMSREFYDDTRYRGAQNAVVTTWLVSFDQIRKSDGARVADLLSFLSCIEPKGIPQSILPRFELEEQMVHAVGTLWGYAFLTRPVARTGHSTGTRSGNPHGRCRRAGMGTRRSTTQPPLCEST